MAQIIDLLTFTDNRGNLTVIEKILPFDIKRIFYIYGVDDSVRGGHRHHKTIQAAVCLKGSCQIFCNDGITKKTYLLENPSFCLLLNPSDWHIVYGFSSDAILMVVASEYFDPKDFIFDSYEND